MTYHLILTDTQAQIWRRGFWDAVRIQDDIVEEIYSQNIPGLVIVTLPDDSFCFSVSAPWGPGDLPREGRPS